jgi:hypothetical protein
MTDFNWRDRAATLFDCEKQPAVGTKDTPDADFDALTEGPA